VEENAMGPPIEVRREPDGRWVATVPQIPGLAAYGHSREEALVSARKLSAILLEEDSRHSTRILAFYPGELPDYFRPEYSI
jgi:predicted RNase H-like HicB family nuclease